MLTDADGPWEEAKRAVEAAAEERLKHMKHSLETVGDDAVEQIVGRGLHSSTFRLNVSIFCWIHWVHDFPPVY